MYLDWIKFKKGQPDWLNDLGLIERIKRQRQGGEGRQY